MVSYRIRSKIYLLESDNYYATARFFKISELLLSFCYHGLPFPSLNEKRTFREISESPIKSIVFQLLNDSSHPA